MEDLKMGVFGLPELQLAENPMPLESMSDLKITFILFDLEIWGGGAWFLQNLPSDCCVSFTESNT